MRTSAVVAGVACAVFASPQWVIAQGTSEVETVLHKAADTLRMLRTPSEVDRLVTMTYSGTGTTLLGGRTCTMESYRASVRYPIPNAHHTFPAPGYRSLLVLHNQGALEAGLPPPGPRTGSTSMPRRNSAMNSGSWRCSSVSAPLLR